MTRLYDLLLSLVQKANNSVKTEPMVLDDALKRQVRANIGALGEDYVPPIQTAEQVGADPKGTANTAVSTHNSANDSHGDIRNTIQQLANRLDGIANSTDVDLDQLAEIVAYIKTNKSLIDAITSSKVSVADIVDNLTSVAVTNKPLSANQGSIIKGSIDNINTTLTGKPDLSEAEINVLLNLIK